MFCTLKGLSPSVTTHKVWPGDCGADKATAWGSIKGSGPNVMALPGVARVLGASQFCGRPGGGRPSNTKLCTALRVWSWVRQTTGRPLARAWARPVSSSTARRSASRCKALWALSRSDKLTPAVATAIKATTTSSSSRVKPGGRAVGRLLPAAEVGIVALTAGLTVSAKGQHIHLTLDAGIQILIRTAPRVAGQFVQVRLPVPRHGF